MRTSTILVIGGAGFIGSHMALMLKEKGYQCIILDNLSTGHKEAVLNNQLIIGDIANTSLLKQLFKNHTIDAVMHFASFIQVGESVVMPGKYYANNLAATINLLNCMIEANVKYFIFSSTAAVYGEPQFTPITEDHPLAPINPYGHSKRMVEQILADYANAHDFHYTSLRYFNAAGADPLGRLKECHEPETHLIPLILQAAAKNQAITVYGRNYPTVDGTCIRDYIHVTDLCHAHLLALEALWKNPMHTTYNLGTGKGHSVQEVINCCANILEKPIKIIEGKPRHGDPAALVADPTRAMQSLGWQPQYSSLYTIIKHAAQTKHVRLTAEA